MSRYPELDILRGFSLLLMVFYHLTYDLVLFELIRLPFWEGFWWWLPRCVAAAFVLVAGISLALRKARRGDEYGHFLIRGLTLLGVAAGVTTVSYLAFGSQEFVFFGVLHLIAFATLVSYPLLGRPVLSAVLGVFILAAGLTLGERRYSGLALAWLGLRPESRFPADYLPVLPWYAWFLFGIALAALLCPKGERRFNPPRIITDAAPARALAWLGRHTLVIYLVHLPALYGIVWGIAYML